MNKKTQLAEMMRRKEALVTQLKALKEAQAKTGLAYLIESELEKAEVVLAAKSIVEKLQKIAEDLAKVNGDEIMPIMEPLKAAFGPQMAEAFQATVSEHINQTTQAVSMAKDAISAEVGKFEGIMNGTGTNDMAQGVGMDAAAPVAAPADAGMDAGLDGGAVAAAPEADMGDVGADAIPGEDAPLDTAFDTETTSAAGRAKKESAAPKGKMVEGEFKKAKKGENPFADKKAEDGDDKSECEAKEEVSESDAKVLKAFRSAIREGAAPVKAAQRVAARFGIEFSDVVEIVRESAPGK
jgi:hypothetical protein